MRYLNRRYPKQDRGNRRIKPPVHSCGFHPNSRLQAANLLGQKRTGIVGESGAELQT